MRKHLTCPICLGLYKSPKILPCIHSFCNLCLNEYIKRTHTVSYTYASFECPICRASASLGRYADIDVNSNNGWSKKFPSNHQLVAMVDDFMKSQEAGNTTVDKLNEKCQPCFAAGRGSIASYLCVHCFEFMCDSCQMNHKLFKPIKDHTILKKEELPDDISQLKRMIKLGLCKAHPDKEIEFKKDSYGTKEFQCTSCISDSSLYSSKISCLDDKKDNCENAKRTMTNIKHRIGSVIRKQKLDCQRLKEERDDKQNTFGEFLSELKDRVEKSNKLHRAIGRHAQKEIQDLRDSVRICQKLDSLANEELRFIEIVSEYGSNVHGVVLGKDITAKESSLKKSLKNQSNVETVFFDEFMLQEEGEVLEEIKGVVDKRLDKLRDDYRTEMAKNGEQFEIRFLNESKKGSFEPANEISVNADKKDLKPRFTSGEWQIIRIGAYDISIQDVIDDRSSCRSGADDEENDEEHDGEGDQNKNDELEENNGSVTEGEENNGSETEGEENNGSETEGEENDSDSVEANIHTISSHIGSIIFADGDMVFLDKSNRVVKLVNPKFEVIDYVVLEEEPVDIAFIGNGEFAVASSDTVAIYYIHENDTRIIFRSSHKMEKSIKSLCMLGDNFLIMSDVSVDGTSKVVAQEFNKQFEFQREIENLRGSFVGSRNSDDIVVGTRDYVNIFNRNGQMKWWFMRGYMKNVINVSFDTQDNIYMCDEDDHAITVVSPDNYMDFRVVTRMLSKPACVSVNPIKRTIVAGCKEENKVYVYKYVRST